MSQASNVDEFARVVGVIGAITGVSSLGLSYLNKRGALWRRRQGNQVVLSQSLDELTPMLEAANSPLGIAGLWSPTASAALSSINEIEPKLPDWRLRRHVRKFHQVLVEVRGLASPDEEKMRSGAGIVLTQKQRDGVTKADAHQRWIRARLDKTARLGGIQP